jgi:hypothetical protein
MNKMATRKKKSSDVITEEIWPKVIVGSHSTRTEYEDGRVDFVWDWEALQRDVKEAIANYEAENKSKTEIKTTVKRPRKK